MFPEPKVGYERLDRGYLLPEEPEGHPLRCVSFLIPDTIEYRAALYRQVYNLGVTETWDRTDANKAMLASEVWTSALQGSFTVFEDDCPVITQIRPDPSGCGNLEQSTDGGATWEDIPGTDFLPRDGTCAMTGGLEIDPPTNSTALSLRYPSQPTVNPFAYLVATVGRSFMTPQGSWLSTISGNTISMGAVSNPSVTFQKGATFPIQIQQALNPTDTAFDFLYNGVLKHRMYGDRVKYYKSLYLQEPTSIQMRDAALFESAWDVPTDASRAGRFALSAIDYNGTKEIIRGRADGTQAQIGFLGAAPQPALAISGDHRKNPITKQIVELLALFGLCIDNTTDVATVAIIGETQGYDLMAELIEKLEIYSNGGIVGTTSIGDCLLVCEVPPPETYCKVYDFSDEAVRASWTVERGVEGTTGFESTLADEVVFIHTNQFDVFHIIEVTIEYSLSGSSDGSMVMGAYDFTGYTSQTWSGIAAGTGQQLTVDFSPSYDAFTGFRLVAVSNDTAQQIIITGLKVLGYDQGSWGMIPNGVDCP